MSDMDKLVDLKALRALAEKAAVTAANIKKAGGLVAPETMSVGQYFRIASIDEDGHAVLEAVDAPSGVSDVMIDGQSIVQSGVANIPLCDNASRKDGVISYYQNVSISGLDVFDGMIRAPGPILSRISNRSAGAVITTGQLDYAVKVAMCDGKGEAWTDDEKTGAWKRLTSIKTAMDSVAVAGASYFLGTQTVVSIVLPTTAEIGQIISVSWYNGVTAATLSITGKMLDFTYAPSANSRSEFNAQWDGTYWAVLGHETAVTDDA